MADALVLDWLDEFESLTESEIHTYSMEQEHNHEVMIALYNVLSEPHKYKSDNVSTLVNSQYEREYYLISVKKIFMF